jgi:hypothetical protein
VAEVQQQLLHLPVLLLLEAPHPVVLLVQEARLLVDRHVLVEVSATPDRTRAVALMISLHTPLRRTSWSRWTTTSWR